MAYGIVHFFPGGTKEQYEAVLAVVHPPTGMIPGQIFHAAGPSPGGWTVMAVHDAKESWDRFRSGTLMPKMQQGIKGGFTAAPQETVFEVHKLMR